MIISAIYSGRENDIRPHEGRFIPAGHIPILLPVPEQHHAGSAVYKARLSGPANVFMRKKPMKKILLVPFALLAMGLLTAAAGAQTHTFSGTVTTPDGLSNEFVGGASIVVEPGGHTATTDENGKFSMQLQGGTYTVTTSAQGYGGYTMDLVLGDNKHVVLSLAPAALLRQQGKDQKSESR